MAVPVIGAEGVVAVQAGTSALADFNGDGIDDLAVGVPGENVGAIADAGAVEVFYGGAVRPTAAAVAAARRAQSANDRAAAATRWGSSVRRWARARSISRS